MGLTVLLLRLGVKSLKARKCNIWVFYQMVSSYENGENSLELPIMMYEMLIFLKNEQHLF